MDAVSIIILNAREKNYRVKFLNDKGAIVAQAYAKKMDSTTAKDRRAHMSQ